MNLSDAPIATPPIIVDPPVYYQPVLLTLLALLLALQVYRTISHRSGVRFPMPDARGWIGIGVFVMSISLLGMMFLDKAFREDEFIQTIATLVIGTGFVGGAVSWAYAATKGGGEAAESSQRIAETVAGVPPKVPPPPASVTEAAQQTADAAQDEATTIAATPETPPTETRP